MRCVHAAEMLCEEIFAIEVIVDNVVRVCWWTHVTSPEAELDVLGANMTLPFIL